MIKRVVGWLLVISGMSILFSPFISGFTGFFVTPETTTSTFSVSFKYVIGGAITTIVGLLLIRSKRKSVLE